jgi:predicted ATPase
LEGVPSADAVIAGFTFDRPGDVASRRHRATNVGFGLSYVLPVVLALLSEPGTLCLIENPESHLHPRGQAKLAELAARASKAGVQVFVETHSDHFMDGVRIAVRDGIINPEHAAFHYFEREGTRTIVTSPQIDTDGRLSQWPTGFFDQHEENLVKLLAPRSQNA